MGVTYGGRKGTVTGLQWVEDRDNAKHPLMQEKPPKQSITGPKCPQ